MHERYKLAEELTVPLVTPACSLIHHCYNRAGGLSGLIPPKVKSRTQCCDGDGVIISNIMAGLRSKHLAAHDLLFDYYVFGKTIMQLAYEHHCSDGHIGKKLQNAEGVLDGYLMALEIKLEMDRYVRREVVA